jgi:DNA repair exonuclease SbcCD nuclease subunit
LIQQQIKFAVLGDIHLGHRKNKAVDIINAIDVFFEQYTNGHDLDIIFLEGDVFDKLLDFPCDEVMESTIWIHRFLSFCERFKIKLRVLEGTPSHDWRQSSMFETQLTINKLKVDFKYITTISVEQIPDMGISVLYVPDKAATSPEKIYEEVQHELNALGITQVDMAVMHGMFRYQVPPGIKIPAHTESDYLSIVKHYVLIGHVHTHSVYQRILAAGSFDRLVHGEEEPKGLIMGTIHQDPSEDTYCFIENKLAKKFVTINIKQKEIEQAIAYIEKKVHKLPLWSHIRLRGSKLNPAMMAFDEIVKMFPTLYMTKITTEEEAEKDESLQGSDDIEQKYNGISITRENIVSLLIDGVKRRYGDTEHSSERIEKEILSVL